MRRAEDWRLNVPVTRPGDVGTLVGLGATEFYCGLGYVGDTCLNRRPSAAANLTGWADVEAVTREAHSRHCAVAFVVNDVGYDEELRHQALEQAGSAVQAGCDAIIAADALLLAEMADWEVRRHLSSTAQLTNAASVSFYAAEGAIDRVILPRHLSVAEIATITRAHPALEFEAIVLGDPCQWDDGLCGFEHDLHQFSQVPEMAGGLCSKLVHVIAEGVTDPQEHDGVARRYRGMRRFTGCGLCALPELRSAGVSVLKVAARDKPDLRDVLTKFCAVAAAAQASSPDGTFRAVARDLRQRMAEQFIAGAALRACVDSASATTIGAKVAAVVAESSLLSCDPPFSCYWPELTGDAPD